ncbi:MAG: hypothetical protein GF315_04905 [candidate division Zixibacteria bacterium]|nr:hypothetical protein [candidate division Zixibacteria bacterium]
MVATKLANGGVIILVIGLLLLLLQLYRSFSKMRGKKEDVPKFRSKFASFVDVVIIFIGGILIIFSQLIFWLSANMRYHIPSAENQVLGTISTYSHDETYPQLGFQYTPQGNDEHNQPFRFELSGYKWSVSGEMVDWPEWTSIFSLNQSCKINSINSSGFTDQDSVRMKGVNIYSIGGGKSKVFDRYDDFGVLFFGIKVKSLVSDTISFYPEHSYVIMADSTGLVLKERD